MNKTLLTIAKELAKPGTKTKIPRIHISIITLNKSIMAVGTNLEDKTHTALLNYPVYARVHSEIAAYAKLNYKIRQLPSLVLHNFAFTKQLQIKNSSPCATCVVWCVDAFNEIYYTNNNGVMEKL